MDDTADGRMGKTLHEMTENRTGGRIFRAVATLVGVGLFMPMLMGLWQTLLPAVGRLDAIGETDFNLDAWRRLFELPGFTTSLKLTVATGLFSTLIALVLTTGFFAGNQNQRLIGAVRKLMNPLLASPHAAVAIALAFLIAPSGWLFRILSPWATGSDLPPNTIIVHDPLGLALILGLAIKETPFLIFIAGSALKHLPVSSYIAAGRTLGYGRTATWLRVIFPQLYPQIRLALYAVLAFSLSVIDASIILGPNNPPTLAVQTLRWFSDPNVEMILPAAASAILQAMIVVTGIGFWWLGERLVAFLGCRWIERGNRESWTAALVNAVSASTLTILFIGLAALIGLLVWSFARRWSFPNTLPENWTADNWLHAANGWLPALRATFTIAAISTIAALCLAIAWLEAEDRSRKHHLRLLSFFIYIPLILPQTAFVFGLHISLLRVGITGSYIAVVWAHVLFVFPYVMLVLADPWRSLDTRYARAASSLGHTPLVTLFRVKLPILLAPLLAAAAVGFAVSVAQYLPTLAIGEGRIETLTTEAVSRASGGDRRITAVFASLQAILPLAAYALAFLVPAILYSRRKGLLGDRA